MGVTTEEQAPAEAVPDDGSQDGPVLGEIVVGTSDGQRVIRWTLGGVGTTRGLTPAGIAAAATATGRWLGSLSPGAVPRGAQVRISAGEWSVPLVRGQEAVTEALMTETVNEHGSIGQLA